MLTMYWVNFLHIYQPIEQSKEILKKVVHESYRPLFKGFLGIKNIKVNLNINASLTELFVKEGYQDVVDNIRKLAETGRLEFTESAKYHPLLPFLGEKEIIRQIKKNNQDNRKYFGKSYKPVCFFPPEMAYSRKVAEIVSRAGYSMMIIDDIAYNGGKEHAPKDKLYAIGNTKVTPVFRERRVSNSIMSAVVRSKKEFVSLVDEELGENKYLCTAMDGETFGHHRPGLEKFLFNIIKSEKPKQIFLSELPRYFEINGSINPVKSTWASTQEDVAEGVQFYSWKDPRNEVHRFQWKFLNFLLETANKKKINSRITDRLDVAMASDQFFWASGEPWWSLEMIEKGAIRMLNTLKSLPGVTKKEVKKGEDFYREIVAKAFWWQRSGKIEAMARKYKETVRIPFKERAEKDVYYAFLKILEREMKKAARKRNFEKAILWRDAMWKLETKNDIFDAIHVIDMLRMEMPQPELEKMLAKYRKEYEKISPGQPELRRIIK